MPDDKVPKEFFDAVDEFVRLANNLNEKWPTSRISSAIMYAAARYNAFNFHALDQSPAANFDRTVDYFCQQYRSMLLENMEAMKPSNPPRN